MDHTIDTATEEGADPAQTAGKGARVLRIWGIALLLLPLCIGILILEWGVSSWVRGLIRQGLSSDTLEMSEDTGIHASMLRSSVAIDDLLVHDLLDPDHQAVHQSQELRIDFDSWSLLFGPDRILRRLASDGTRISLRRREDGSIPGLPEDVVQQKDVESRDWLDLYEQLQTWWQRYQEWDWVLGRFPGPRERPEPRPSPAWQNAQYHPPSLAEDQPRRRWIIAELLLRGDRIRLPDAIATDQQGRGAFDITHFDVRGEHVTLRVFPGEEMRLHASLRTAAAGELRLDLLRNGLEGDLRLHWQELPLDLLKHPQVAGRRLAAYGAEGSVDIQLQSRWQKDAGLQGSILLLVHNLQLNPTTDAPRLAHDLALRLRQNPLPLLQWQIDITGSLAQPQFSGFGLQPLQDAIIRSLEEEARQRLGEHTDEARQRLDEEVERSRERIDREAERALDGRVDEASQEQIERLREGIGSGLRERIRP